VAPGSPTGQLALTSQNRPSLLSGGEHHAASRLAAHHPLVGLAIRSSEYTSFIERTPVSTLNASASCESLAAPEFNAGGQWAPAQDIDAVLEMGGSDRPDDVRVQVRMGGLPPRARPAPFLEVLFYGPWRG
jgi:hypothetical protein